MRLYITILLVIINSVLFAQKNVYNVSLTNAVTSFNSSNNKTDYTSLIQDLEKLNASNSKDWIPAYYLSLIYVRLSIANTDLSDEYADKALYWANKSLVLNANDETYCAYTMSIITKMSVNPFIRWLKYKGAIYENLGKAKKINPSNPRVYLLEAKLNMNIPKVFGGGCKQTKPLIIKAQHLMENQLPQSVLPSWGKQILHDLKEACAF